MPSDEEPTFAELLDWIEGRLSDAESSRLAALVQAVGPDTDTDTNEMVAWIRSFLALAAEQQLETPPAGLRQRLVELFAVSGPHGLDQYHDDLELVFDSRRETDLVGVRGPGALVPDAVQLVFRVSGVDVVIDVTHATGGQARLDGQLFDDGPGRAIWTVGLETPDGWRTTTTDDLGSFGFAAVAPGSARIVASTSGRHLSIHLPPDLLNSR